MHLHVYRSYGYSEHPISCVHGHPYLPFMYNTPFFGRESIRPSPPFLYCAWQWSKQGRLPCVTLEGNRTAAGLTRGFHMHLKLHVVTMLSQSLLLVCQFLPMPHSKRKSEDCAREEQKMPMSCTAAPHKIPSVPIPPIHTHIYMLFLYIYTHTVTSLNKFPYPVTSTILYILLHPALKYTGRSVYTGALQAVPSFPLLCCPQPILFFPSYHLHLFPD